MRIQRLSVEHNGGHSKPQLRIVRNQIAVHSHRRRINKGSKHRDAFVHRSALLKQCTELIHKADHKDFDCLGMRTCADKAGNTLLCL